MIKIPNYNKDNLINLISSISKALGNKPKYNELDLLKGEELAKYDNIILFEIDALGFNWLEKYGKDSFLYSKLQSKLNTLFPSTTATVTAGIMTGLTASEHAITGHKFFMKDLGSIIDAFKWINPITNIGLGNEIPKNFILSPNMFGNTTREIHIVLEDIVKDSAFNLFLSQDIKRHGMTELNEYFGKTIELIKTGNKKKFIFTYWPNFDAYSHEYGTDSKKLLNHFKEIDKEFKKLNEELKNTNSIVIVTSDHGQINCPNRISVKEKYPDLYNLLLMPLCGGERFQYCYVKNGMRDEFQSKAKVYLEAVCDILPKKTALGNNYFGEGRAFEFTERIGDFILLPKEGYYIVNDETEEPKIGYHGGLSEDEVIIPLIILK